jgi:type VI secretion system protein ImpF
MFEPKPIKGAKALLFERLVDEHPNVPREARPFRIYGIAALRESVRRELMRLLNTRCPQGSESINELERTVIDYGVPDFAHVAPAGSTDLRRLSHALEHAITAYEPRLKQVFVAIAPAKNTEPIVAVSINAMLVVGSVNEPVSFPLALSLKTGQVSEASGGE